MASGRKSMTSLALSNRSESACKKVALAPNAIGLNMKVHTNAPTTIPDLVSAPNTFASPEEAYKTQSVTSSVLSQGG